MTGWRIVPTKPTPEMWAAFYRPDRPSDGLASAIAALDGGKGQASLPPKSDGVVGKVRITSTGPEAYDPTLPGGKEGG